MPGMLTSWVRTATHQQQQRGEDREMLPRVRAGSRARSSATRDLGAREMDRHRDEQQRQEHERERESHHRLDRRQHEHVVADVASEDRIGLTPNGVRFIACSAVFHCDAIASATRKAMSAVHGSASVRINRAACAPTSGGDAADVGDRARALGARRTTSPRSAYRALPYSTAKAIAPESEPDASTAP